MVTHFSPLQQEDSVLLWKSVCSNKLLANVELVLFMNKCDILEAKLKSGIRLAKYVRSFGDRTNDLDTATKCACWRPDVVCDPLILDRRRFPWEI